MIESRHGILLQGLVDLIAYIDSRVPARDLRIAEVGTYKGDSARVFAAHFKRVYCIDAWEQAIFNVPNTSAAAAEAEFDRVVCQHKNIVKVKGRSTDVARSFNARVDVVYIDAGHAYEEVRADIMAWAPKASHFLCGHDYWKKFPGVIRAVDECLGRKPEALFADSSWLIEVMQ
jgi:hypothetical protein